MPARVRAVNAYDTERTTGTITRPANTTAYTIGDVIAAVTTDDYYTFSGLQTEHGFTGTIERALCVSSANQATLPDLQLFLFSAAMVEVADNGPAAFTDAEMLTLIGIIDFSVNDWVAGAIASGASGNAVCKVDNLGMPYVAAGDDMYGQLVVRNAYTPVSSEVFTVTLLLSRD